MSPAKLQAMGYILPASLAEGIGVRTLLAPSVNEQTTISWAGQTVGKNGELEGVQTTHLSQCKDGCVVTVAAPAAVLVQLDPDAADTDWFYQGNSTIAGVAGFSSLSTAMRPELSYWFALSSAALAFAAWCT